MIEQSRETDIVSHRRPSFYQRTIVFENSALLLFRRNARSVLAFKSYIVNNQQLMLHDVLLTT